jgi:hypothetical protein
VERGQQTRRAHRFEQVVDGVEFEGADRILVVGGGEDHCRRRLAGGLARRQLLGEADVVEAWHADVDQRQVDGGFGLRQQLQRLDAVGRFADDLVRQLAGDVAEQIAQTGARRRFVVDDQQAQRRQRGVVGHGRAPWR